MAYAGGVRRLIQVVQELSSARQLNQVMALVRSAARDIADADGATFVFKDNGFCFYADEDAISPLWKGQRFPLHTCISGWSMLNKKAVVIEDIYVDDRIPHDAYRPTFVKSLAMTPIRKADPIGAIGTYWSQQHVPTEEQLELLQALGDATSIALENVYLYSSLEKRITELNEASRAKDEFLMTVSHELRTPLNAILGWSEILLENDNDPKEVALGLETIERNARAQNRIIDDLFDTSRIILNRLELVLRPVDLVPIAKGAFDSVRLSAERRQVHLHWESHVPSAIVLGDADRLQQIIYNILANAIKFSNPGGNIYISLNRKGPGIQFEVRDEGIGISSDFLPHIFERFKQADGSMTRKHNGLGLGLAIVQHLVHAHNGQVHVFSAGLEQGATFTITIPLINSLGNETSNPFGTYAEGEPTQTKTLSGKTILVVDDDDDSRMVVEAALRKSGAQVHSAISVDEALTKAHDAKPDLIVCDLSMPGEDGYSLVAKLRQGRTALSAKTPIVALTAFADPESQKRALAAGFDLFFGKPFIFSRFIKSIAELT